MGLLSELSRVRNESSKPVKHEVGLLNLPRPLVKHETSAVFECKVYPIICFRLNSELQTTLSLFLSYMETEKYEEAVRDYEKVCKMDRSRGEISARLESKDPSQASLESTLLF